MRKRIYPTLWLIATAFLVLAGAQGSDQGTGGDLDSDSASGAREPGAARNHWAFRPLKTIRSPDVHDRSWVRTGVDAFIRARLAEQGWSPAPPASPAEWIRRVSLDLVGLPPDPSEVQELVDHDSPLARERVVDRLLASPHYGERWAQHWLDVVRYAETEGYEYDRHIPDAWRFRDYVIESLNADKPFDQFLVEQIAGDELDPGNAEYQVASIFHRLGPVRRNAGNPEIALSRNEVLTERTDVIGAAFLGLTIGCARCHNHKLEPLSQRDYYRLQAYFGATDEHNIVLASAEEKAAWDAENAKLTEEIQAIKKIARLATGEEKDRLDRQIEALEEKLPSPLPTIPATRNNFASRTPIHVLRRGVWENKGEAVGPRPPSVLVPADFSELPADVPVPRTHLARWLASGENPLTARVIANRIWQYHFGVGLVKTANDFGIRGDPPSHPELLDWLAARLVENGWRFKAIHRLIVLSSAYGQSTGSPHADEYRVRDPENRWLWRFNRRRLSAEELRDAMLAVSGRLNRTAGGPSVMVPVDRELVQLLYKPSQWQVAARSEEFDRRTIYLMAKRNLRLPFLDAFDAPALLTSCARRESSTHALQTLEMLNGQLSNALAEALAARLSSETDGTSEAMIDKAYRLTVGRSPSARELELSKAFLERGPIEEQPLREFALALFNLNEFLYAP